MKVNEFRLRLYPDDFYGSREFFLNVFGFSIRHEWDEPDSKGVMFDVGGTTLEFLWPDEGGYGDLATGSGLSLAVDDVWKLFDELKDKVEIKHSLRDNSWGDTSFGVVTPQGYKISFFTKTNDHEN